MLYEFLNMLGFKRFMVLYGIISAIIITLTCEFLVYGNLKSGIIIISCKKIKEIIRKRRYLRNKKKGKTIRVRPYFEA